MNINDDNYWNMRECQICNSDNDRDDNKCPTCGADLKRESIENDR